MNSENLKETLGFQTETKQLLNLMVHSLYSNKEIFLRELISNASDAVDKLRFEALSNPKILENESDFKVWITFNKDAGTLTIRDNGIGMSRNEIIHNLGTIAKSGTADFCKNLTGDKSKDSKLVGQFGVGFYSSFIVAHKVRVRSRKAGISIDQAVCWTSEGKGTFDIENITRKQRGTEIDLYLKEEQKTLLSDWKLRSIINKYSDHIDLPIVMLNDKKKEELVNRATALWHLPKNNISNQQYQELYKHITHDFEDALAWTHNKVEGNLEYINLLYIPSKAPVDLWSTTNKRGLKLYVQRVFIMDDSEQFLPHYLRFVRGIIDANNLPLNVSREILQNSQDIKKMRNAIIKRILNLLEYISKDESKYAKFWNEFGQVLKEGPAEDPENKERIANLLRFNSTNHQEKYITLEQYISRMSKDQNKIYYVAADTFNAAQNSPHLEIFYKKGIEVLLLSNRIDEWLIAHLTEFSGKKFQSIVKGDLKLEDLSDNKKSDSLEHITKDMKPLLKKIQNILKDKVKEVRFTRRLIDSPACIVADENDITPQMERIMRAAGQNVPKNKIILELNPKHVLIKKIESEKDEQCFIDRTWILFDQAILAEGGQLDNPTNFVLRLNKLLI